MCELVVQWIEMCAKVEESAVQFIAATIRTTKTLSFFGGGASNLFKLFIPIFVFGAIKKKIPYEQ